MNNNPAATPISEAAIRIVLDGQHSVLSADEGIEGLLGFPASDFVAGTASLSDRLHPDDLDIFSALLGAPQPEACASFNIRLRHRDGRIRCIKGDSRRHGEHLELLLRDACWLAQPHSAQALAVNFVAMMENTDDFIYFKDRNHVFTGASQTLVSVTEPSEHWSDLLGKTDYDVFPETYADIYYRLEKQVFAGMPVAQEIHPYLTTDGKAGWVDNRKYPIRDAQGEIIGLFGIARDVTHRVQAEQSLKNERETLQIILDHAPIGIWLQDAEGKVRIVNKAICKALGIPEARFLAARDYTELFPAEYCQPLLDADEAALAGRDIDISRQRLAFADGHIHDLRVIKAIKRDEQGRPQALVGLSMDITQELMQEKILRESEERFRTILEQVPSISIQGYDKQRRVIFWNPASEKLYGIRRQDALGKPLESLIVPEPMRAEVIRLITAWTSGGPAIPAAELTLQRGDGSPVEVFSSHVMLRGLNGEPEIYCIDIDISERKRVTRELEQHRLHLEDIITERTAELLRAKEAAETANVAKSAFLANMSHEIRTPLNAITGMAHLIRKFGLPPAQAERLGKLEAATEHLLGILNAILDLSKIEAGKFELEDGPVHIASLLDNVTSMLHSRAESKGLKLVVEAPEIRYRLTGDASRLQQALLNYAANAVKFSQHGRIRLRIRPLQESTDSVLLHFEVEDSGIGIAPATLTRLFNVFEQADNSMTRKYGGTGLGLAITRKLAHLMGGEVGASSTEGVGSRFWFTARLKKGPHLETLPPLTPTGSAEALLQRDFAGRHILLAEDEPINQEITRMMLSDAGLLVDLAEDGQQAVELASRKAYALILMDMQMPRLDGLEATHRIRQSPHGATVPILAMTANAFAEDKARCMAAGMNDFIAKPVDPGNLYECLLKWLQTANPA